jgi:hypothetical protein
MLTGFGCVAIGVNMGAAQIVLGQLDFRNGGTIFAYKFVFKSSKFILNDCLRVFKI